MGNNVKRRIERLEKEYFPGFNREGFYLNELIFMKAFMTRYEGCEDVAPPVLRHVHDRLQERWRRSVAKVRLKSPRPSNGLSDDESR